MIERSALNLRSRLSRAFREAEGLLLFAAIAFNLIAVPGTFGWLLYHADDWSLLNFAPRIISYAGLSVAWFLFWPAHWIFG